jgi:hypothetical protein
MQTIPHRTHSRTHTILHTNPLTTYTHATHTLTAMHNPQWLCVSHDAFPALLPLAVLPVAGLYPHTEDMHTSCCPAPKVVGVTNLSSM